MSTGNFFGNKTARRDFQLTSHVTPNPGPADYDIISAALRRAAAAKEPSQMALAHVTGSNNVVVIVVVVVFSLIQVRTTMRPE